jgi:HK97 family phage prohead protease
MAKTFICSDESINRYGFRVLTSGIDITNFKKNPVMLFDHESMSWGGDIYNGPIGRWDEIKKSDGQLLANAIIDEDDPKGKILSNKVEKDFIRAASIGFRIIETSEDPKLMLPGQTRPTVTKCELIEISIVGIPANKNAISLYDDAGTRIELKDDEGYSQLGLGIIQNTPTILSMKKINLKAGSLALAAFFGISAEQAKNETEIEFTAEKQDELNAKLSELATLSAEKTRLEGELSAANTAKTALEGEKTSLTNQLATANAEIIRLGKQPGTGGADPEAGSKEGAEGSKEELEFTSEADSQLAQLKATLGIK